MSTVPSPPTRHSNRVFSLLETRAELASQPAFPYKPHQLSNGNPGPIPGRPPSAERGTPSPFDEVALGAYNRRIFEPIQDFC